MNKNFISFTCEGGKYGTDKFGTNATGGCNACPQGFYRPSTDDNPSRCSRCKFGKTTTIQGGARACDKCELGKMGNVSKPGFCLSCKSGRFSDTRGEICENCEVGKIPNAQKTACEKPPYKVPSDCKLGIELLNDTSSDNDEHQCITCPLGGDCTFHTRLSKVTKKNGYMNYSWSNPNNPFAECPYEKTCINQTCTKGNYGTVCAICIPNHFQNVDGTCSPCSPASRSARVGALATLLLFLLFCYFTYRHFRQRIKKLKAKAESAANQYAAALEMGLEYGGDGLKIFTVFLQISSSSPGVLQLKFPQAYINFLASFSWINFDVLSLLGLDCVGTTLDFRAGVALICLLPVLVVVASGIMYLTYAWKKTNIEVTEIECKDAVSNLFDLTDVDGSGFVEPKEFKTLLKELGHTRLDMSHVEHMMKRINTLQKVCVIVSPFPFPFPFLLTALANDSLFHLMHYISCTAYFFRCCLSYHVRFWLL